MQGWDGVLLLNSKLAFEWSQDPSALASDIPVVSMVISTGFSALLSLYRHVLVGYYGNNRIPSSITFWYI